MNLIMLSFSVFLFILVTVFNGGCQGTLCPVNPESYTFEKNALLNLNDISGCSVQNRYTTCLHPSILTDSDTQNGYFQWKGYFLLLFTFPSAINLTSITFYYLDGKINDAETTYGLIGLTILAVDDNFTLGSSPIKRVSILEIDSHINIEDPNAGLINASASFNIARPTVTRKVLLEPSNTKDTRLALSEVEFFEFIDNGFDPTTTPPDKATFDSTENLLQSTQSPGTSTTTSQSNSTSTKSTSVSSGESLVTIIGALVAVLVVMILTGVISVIVIVIFRKRKSRKEKLHSDVHKPQLHLSPLTGQVESPSSQRQEEEYDPTYDVIIDTNKKKRPKKSSTSHSDKVPDCSMDNPSDATYAVVDKKKKRYTFSDANHSTDYPADATYAVVDKKKKKVKNSKPSGDDEHLPAADPDHSLDNPVDATYAVVDKKKKKKSNADHSTDCQVDATYAVVDKKKKKKNNSEEDQQHQAEPTLESKDDPCQATYAVVEKSKKKKEEEPLSDGDPPPIPQHTVDQLYATVHKKLANNTKTPPEDNDDDAPPIPPYTVDD